jgi:uracil-DNA glycosylase
MEIQFNGRFEEWKKHAREALRNNVAPEAVHWSEQTGQQDLFASTAAGSNVAAVFRPPALLATQRESPAQPSPITGNGLSSPTATAQTFRVPKRFLDLAKKVAAHRDPTKWRVLYSVLYRIEHENHNLLKVETDDEVVQLLRMEDAVCRDIHHMHAFVRFKKIVDSTGASGGARFVAWYQPDHHIIELAAPFFAARFAAMRWSILTPTGSAHWDGERLTFGEGVAAPPATAANLSDGGDGLEELWNKYYATTFNPARTNLKMMRSEMPSRFWNQLPEVANLPNLLAQAPERVEQMVAMQKKTPGASQFVPPQPDASLTKLREAVQSCQGCELYKFASQAVFGEGPAHARVMLIGEQPGDQEDRAGKPFVGPAGEVLNRALVEAGLDRAEVYVTNAVKHFAFEERGKRRIHRTPRLSEVTACRPWLEAEVAQVAPEIIVCLGATAAKTIFGAQFRLTEQRGQFLESRFAQNTLATYHPSAVLRGDTQEARDNLYNSLVSDLKVAAKANAHTAKPPANANPLPAKSKTAKP